MSKFNASRGGHTPGHLREAFIDFVEEGEINTDSFDDPSQAELSYVTGQLWNCTDVMPGDVCDYLDLPHGSTFARGARELRAQHEG